MASPPPAPSFRRAGESRKTRKLKAREVGDDDRVHESFDARQEADSDDEDEEEWDSDGQPVADEWEEVHAAGSDTDYDDMMDIGSTQEKDDVMGKLSEYEKRRLENIARNDAAIALLSEKFPLASLPKKGEEAARRRSLRARRRASWRGARWYAQTPTGTHVGLVGRRVGLELARLGRRGASLSAQTCVDTDAV